MRQLSRWLGYNQSNYSNGMCRDDISETDILDASGGCWSFSGRANIYLISSGAIFDLCNSTWRADIDSDMHCSLCLYCCSNRWHSIGVLARITHSLTHWCTHSTPPPPLPLSGMSQRYPDNMSAGRDPNPNGDVANHCRHWSHVDIVFGIHLAKNQEFFALI